MMKRLLGSTFIAGALIALIACERRTVEFVPPPPEEGPSFSSSPESGVIGEPEAGLTEYCPAYSCREPFTTCPSSRFPCDVNIMADPNNCGACGVVCPSFGGTVFDCVEGKCAITCLEGHADCNGLLDDACEVAFGTNQHCNGCGDVCPDPAKPCMWDEGTMQGKCGCDGDQVVCRNRIGTGVSCADTKTSDSHCGACGVRCPSTGDAGSPPANMYYGCADSECGRFKCQSGWANCDGDLEDGCETSLLLPTSCGGCNIVCGPGQSCVLNSKSQPECMCPPGETLCGNSCVDLRTSLQNCGGCGISCVSSSLTAPNGIGTCSYGACGFACKQGFGDCNGDPTDGCETNLNSDPRNCGACGNSCDVLLGQPCMRGQCAVEPCLPGEETR